MEWETAADIAACPKRPGYEMIADQVTVALKIHNIKVVIMYYSHQSGLVLPTSRAGSAEGFLVLVNVTDKTAAKRVLGEEIEKGLRVKLLKKSILEPEK